MSDKKLIPFSKTVTKPNPYQLVWYKQGWSNVKTKKNNAKYWLFEIEHNNLFKTTINGK